ALSLNLRTRKGDFNTVALPAGAFGTILAANVMHFMDPAALEATCRKMFNLLAPGGKVFVISKSPYQAPLRNFIPVYEQRKASGEKWPGFIPDAFINAATQSGDQYSGPMHMHALEPALLSRAFAEAGLSVDKAEFKAAAK